MPRASPSPKCRCSPASSRCGTARRSCSLVRPPRRARASRCCCVHPLPALWGCCHRSGAALAASAVARLGCGFARQPAGAYSYGPPVDMWAVGCILAELLLRQPIFPGAGAWLATIVTPPPHSVACRRSTRSLRPRRMCYAFGRPIPPSPCTVPACLPACLRPCMATRCPRLPALALPCSHRDGPIG